MHTKIFVAACETGQVDSVSGELVLGFDRLLYSPAQVVLERVQLRIRIDSIIYNLFDIKIFLSIWAHSLLHYSYPGETILL